MGYTENMPDMSKIPGGWADNTNFVIATGNNQSKMDIYADYHSKALIIHDAIHKDSVTDIIDYFRMKAPNYSPVSVQGNQDIIDDRIGSVRATLWNPELAKSIFRPVNQYFHDRFFTDFTATDWYQNSNSNMYRPIFFSPMLRYMKYQSGGQHYPHYDAGYIYANPKWRTLMSFVLYLTDNETGCTRFIKDMNDGIKVSQRSHADWTRNAEDCEVITSIKPRAGSMLVFDHRLCHDVSQFDGPGERIIIRGDLIYCAI